MAPEAYGPRVPCLRPSVRMNGRARRFLTGLLCEEKAQAGFELLMVMGTVVIAFIAAFYVAGATLFPAAAGYMCPLIDTAANPPASVGSCLGP